MTKRTRRRRSKKRRPDFFQKNRFLLLLMGITGCAVIGLILFARMEEAPQKPALPPITKPPVDYSKELRAEVETLLSGLNVDGGTILREPGETPARYTLEANLPTSDQIADFQGRLKRFPGDYTVQLGRSQFSGR